MTTFAFVFAALAALASVLLGRNLSRSIFAAFLSVGALTVALAGAGFGFEAALALFVAGLLLVLVQLLGWMLVDVDRDHLPPTDAPTALARSLAFAVLATSLALLAYWLPAPGGADAPLDVAAWGARLFGEGRSLVLLCGLLAGAGLLATLMALRDDGEAS